MNDNQPTKMFDLSIASGEPEGKPKLVLQNESFKHMRLAMPAGKTIPEHKAAKEITVLCLSGRVAFTASEESFAMNAGNLISLSAGELHSLTATTDSVVIITMAK
ncbi:cupin domain-containing protein [Rubripirellula reticaptiva]|uniref:Cupin domain protein n=1 Tax=Rubripirellula reticaptiva TaxID=2528013 RepID=A0A5C6EVZ0_9BACT|nr:cupin domain-containing protein [Rubripirellula reticaptiva]TWU51836.1 Cupin domain protein [Rubripirellula reticaptiva]